jgi:hypothetical protein
MRSARYLRFGLVLVSLGAVAGCRPARGPQGVPAPGVGADFSRAYQGQARILPALGEKSKITVARGARLEKGTCDLAVLVASATLQAGTARLTLEPIGLPWVDMRPVGRPCERPSRELTLIVSGLDPRAALPALSEEIDRVLQTPERYLAERGLDLKLKPAGVGGPLADKRLQARPEERMLARALTRGCQRALSVAPILRDDRKSVHYQGEVEFEAVVGADGRLREARLLGSLSVHAERILAALELWRFDPARRGDEPIAFRLEDRTVFRIF